MVKWTHPDFIINPTEQLKPYYQQCNEMQDVHKTKFSE